VRDMTAATTDRAGDGRTLDVEFHRRALVEAGFPEAAEVWRHREDAVLLAIR
jgi:hypothetical protein